MAYVAGGSLVLLVVVTLLSGNNEQFVPHAIEAVRNTIDEMGVAAPFVYSMLYILVALTGFSTSILSLIAIGLFSPLMAFAIIVVSATLAAVFAFTLSRLSTGLRLFSNTTQTDQQGMMMQKIVKSIKKNAHEHGFRSILLLRLARMPYIALSYGAGLVPALAMRHFMWATILTNTLSAAVYVLVGVAIIQYVGLLTAGLLVAGGLYWIWQQRQN